MNGGDEAAFGWLERVSVWDVDGHEEDSGREGAIGWSDDGGVEVGEVVVGRIAGNAGRGVRGEL